MSESHAVSGPLAEVNLPKLIVFFFPPMVFFAFMALCIRGVFEVTIGKSLAYLTQLVAWTLVQFFAVAFFRFRVTPLLTIGLAFTFLFGASAVISCFVTMGVSGFAYGIVTTVVNIYLLSLFVAGYGFRTDAFTAKPVTMAMALAGVLLPLVGSLQLFGFAMLPGSSLLRPPSLTGSYLHFPLLAGVLCICLLQAAKSLRWFLLYPISLLCFFGVVISGGRSGALVLVATAGLYLVFEFFRQPHARKVKFATIALICITVLAVALVIGYQYSVNLQRIAQLWNLQEEGNALRIKIWQGVFAYWQNTNLWFGEYTGLIGNTSSNLVGGGVGLVAESGALQQLINFGLIGFLCFYAVMLFGYLGIEKEMTFLRALFISAMIQTAFYQSTEVFPYMAMLAFLPSYSRSLQQAEAARYSSRNDNAITA